jgi:methylated-DNA-[protein]-cysteine S-methyltransferase
MLEYTIFRSKLGWMGIIGQRGTLVHLTFGHATARSAHTALPAELLRAARRRDWNPPLVARLRAYAAGTPDDFADVPVASGPATPFRRRVLDACRKIAYGQTCTYGQLAARAGSPRAARAVGNCMSSNQIPLVIPCHRVVPSGGKLGSYSAPAGTAMKRHLLALEAHDATFFAPPAPGFAG